MLGFTGPGCLPELARLGSLDRFVHWPSSLDGLPVWLGELGSLGRQGWLTVLIGLGLLVMALMACLAWEWLTLDGVGLDGLAGCAGWMASLASIDWLAEDWLALGWLGWLSWMDSHIEAYVAGYP